MSSCDTTLPSLPSGYDLITGRTCSFLINVAIDMGSQWISLHKPTDPNQFSKSWTPKDTCPVTSDHTVNDYTFGEPIWSTFKYYDVTSKISLTATEPFGFIATKIIDGAQFLVFRGTQTAQDFIADTEDTQVPYDGNSQHGLVGKGFKRVFTGMLNTLQEFRGNSSGKLTVTGHSLGSALATLAVPLYSDIEVQQYNQASPRVGDSTFAAYLQELGIATYRLVNTDDVVPKLPTKNFIHVGCAAEFTANYPGDSEKQTLANNHNACCSYSYAIYHLDDPVNHDFSNCTEKDAAEYRFFAS